MCETSSWHYCDSLAGRYQAAFLVHLRNDCTIISCMLATGHLLYANLPSFSKERYYSPKRINLMRTQCLDLDLIRAIKGEVFKTKGRRFGWLPKVFEKTLHYHLIAAENGIKLRIVPHLGIYGKPLL